VRSVPEKGTQPATSKASGKTRKPISLDLTRIELALSYGLTRDLP